MLHITNTLCLSLKDAGSYVCSADNGLGQVNKAELSLDVLYAPVATLPPKREVKEGENVEIECKIASNPRPATIQVRNCTKYTNDL